MADAKETRALAIEGPPDLAGEELGEGPPVILLHGVTATRRYVLHGSKALARRGHRQISYDARGHGESEPGPGNRGYGYPELASDLGRAIEAAGAERPVLAGHSMGCHTAAAYAIEHPDELAGLVLVGPVVLGLPAPPESIARWDELADDLEQDGVDGFMAAYERQLDLDPDWTETVMRFTRERLERHRHPEAVAQAMREVARSSAFDGLGELEALRLPALVVASGDEADPAHPRSVAEAWEEALPLGRLTSEEPGEAPLAWQGGKLARAIAEFCERPEVAERHA